MVYFENDARIHLARGRKATVVRVMGVLAKSLDSGNLRLRELEHHWSKVSLWTLATDIYPSVHSSVAP